MEDNGCLRPRDVVGPGLPQGLDNMPKALEKEKKKNDMNIPEKILYIFFFLASPQICCGLLTAMTWPQNLLEHSTAFHVLHTRPLLGEGCLILEE